MWLQKQWTAPADRLVFRLGLGGIEPDGTHQVHDIPTRKRLRAAHEMPKAGFYAVDGSCRPELKQIHLITRLNKVASSKTMTTGPHEVLPAPS